MLIGNIAQIAGRALFDRGIPFVFPMTMFLFVWLIFVGFFVIQRHGADITVDFFIERFGRLGHRISRLFVNLLTIALMGTLIWHTPRWLIQQIGDEVEMVGVDRWIQNVPLLIACVLILLNVVVNLAYSFHKSDAERFPAYKR